MSAIGILGTDGRTFLSALDISNGQNGHQGVVVRGTTGQHGFAAMLGDKCPIRFVSTDGTDVDSYFEACAAALRAGTIDWIVPMPEALQLNGFVDRMVEAGLGDRVAGLQKKDAQLEGNKIWALDEILAPAGVGLAAWQVVDARDFTSVCNAALGHFATSGGCVFKYPYGDAGGKSTDVMSDPMDIDGAYRAICTRFSDNYKKHCGGEGPWPLIVAQRIAGYELSVTALVDANGNYQVLPTSGDGSARYSGSPGPNNPTTGGMFAFSPHPFETPALLEEIDQVVGAIVRRMRDHRKVQRPYIIYLGCTITFPNGSLHQPKIIVFEANIRLGEPEGQVVIGRLKNWGELLIAMFEGRLDQVIPDVREDQIAVTVALVTGPGGPDGQKGYPWRYTKGEPLLINETRLKKHRTRLIPSGMSYDEDAGFKSDGTRVCYLAANAASGDGKLPVDVADLLGARIQGAFDSKAVRVVPREDHEGQRLDLRSDVALMYFNRHHLFPEG